MVSRRTNPVSADAPEGPYEAADRARIDPQSHIDVRQVAHFVEAVEAARRDRLLPELDGRGLGIAVELMRNYVSGRLTTPTSLAHASGLSHGTAIRTIDELARAGLIVRRARTQTGKSVSLHPSSELLRRWQAFATALRDFAADLTAEPRARPDARARPRAQSARAVIPPPAVLKTKLALSKGLRLLVHADPTFMAMNALKRQFEVILGVEIQSRALSIDRLQREIVENGAQRVSAYDIIACDMPWFGEMGSAGLLRPLDDLLLATGCELGDFVPDAIASARWRGSQYGIPVLATAEMLVYRRDLLGEAGVEPPRTIPALLEAARILHRPERGTSGIAWNGGRGTALGHTFMTLMAAHGEPVVALPRDRDGEFDIERAQDAALLPAFLSEAARETAEVLRELLSLSPPEILSMVWYDRARAFASGRTALAYSHTLLAHLFAREPASPAYGQTGYLPHPTGLEGRPVAPLGGYALAIPANIAPDRVEAAWTALSMLTSASAAKLYILNGSLASPRFSVNGDPDVAAVSDVVGVVDRMARERTLRMWPRPPVPGISAIIRIAGEEMHDMLLGLKAPETALASAQRRAEALRRDPG